MSIEQTQGRRLKADTLESAQTEALIDDGARIAANLANVATDTNGNRAMSEEDIRSVGIAYGIVKAGTKDELTRTHRWMEKVEGTQEGDAKSVVDRSPRRPGSLKKIATTGLVAYGAITGFAQVVGAVHDHYTGAETSVVITDATDDIWRNGTWTEYPDNPNSVFSDLEPLPGIPDSAFSGVGGDYSAEVPTNTPNEAPVGSSEWSPAPTRNENYDPLSDGMNYPGDDPFDLWPEVEFIKPDDSPDSPESSATGADHSSSPEIKPYPDTPQQN